MKRASVPTDLFLDEPFLTASPAQLGIWLRLVCVSTRKLSGGRISCGRWKDEAWQKAAGCDRDGINALVASGLATWDGGALILVGFDLEAEAGYRAWWERNRLWVLAAKPKPKRSSSIDWDTP